MTDRQEQPTFESNNFFVKEEQRRQEERRRKKVKIQQFGGSVEV